MIEVMKKQYNQPNVEVLELRLGNNVMAGSPTGLGISGDPIGGGEGGD